MACRLTSPSASIFERWLRRRLGRRPTRTTRWPSWPPDRPASAAEEASGNLPGRESPDGAPLASDLGADADADFVESVREFRRWFNSTPAPDKPQQDINGLERLAALL